jgi:hypothetical protein
MSDPLIVCICPAHQRPEFVDRAVRCLVRQSYPERYMLLLNTMEAKYISREGVRISDLFQYHKPEWNSKTVGALRNELIQWSMKLLCTDRSGYMVQAPDPDYIAHFDYDDISASNRLSCQLAHIQKTGKLVTGFYDCPMYDVKHDKIWIYENPRHSPYAVGCSLFYKREAWEAHKFPDRTPEDNLWRNAVGGENIESRSVWENGKPLMIQVIHGGNASASIVRSSVYYKEPSEAQEKAVRELLQSA